MNALVRQLLMAGTGSALIVVAGMSAGAQAQSPAADTSAQPQHTIQMVQTLASLDHTLDAKKAKQGEPVTAKLQRDVNIPQQPDLPKNTVLEGRVIQVQPSEHKGDSTVVVTFDKAKLKRGQEVPIKATVLAIAQPAYMQQQPTGEAPGGGAMPASSGGGTPSGTPQGGGATGGGAAASSAPPPQAAPMPAPEQTSSSQQQSPRNGVPGVTLQSDIHQQNSATFTSKGKNVHIPDGTELDVALAVIPAGVRIQSQ
ncbi:MAG TPA: hypothetical protein VFE06_18920 [Acidobacteriaceae bacterium]|jgi:hypothetical protein|nr:hypothetical protein [Acidobacteriaceae bacterium]